MVGLQGEKVTMQVSLEWRMAHMTARSSPSVGALQ